MAQEIPSFSSADSEHWGAHPLDIRMDRLRMRHLRLLDMVARHGSLSAAAERMGMSQPGATKLLQELEGAFSCKLIERSVKGGTLTPAGANILDRLRVALNAIGIAKEAKNSTKELPLVRLGIIPLVGINALGRVIGAIRSENRMLHVQIKLGTVDGLIRGLNDGHVDCVVGFLDDTATSDHVRRLKVIPLWEESLVMVAAREHPLSRRKKIPLDMVRSFDWVLMPKGSANRGAVENLFLGSGLVPPTPCIETESFHIAASLIAGSNMLAAIPESAFRQYQSQVEVLNVEKAFPATRLVFATLKDAQALPAVELLSQLFKKYAHSIS